MFTIRRAKKVFKHCLRIFRKKEKSLSPEQISLLKKEFQALNLAIETKNKEGAKKLSEKLKSHPFLERSSLKRFIDSFIGLAIALFIALLIRQMWFELYIIPTGSMRPTLKEKDLLAVSKTKFGINTPFRTGHLAFDDKLLPHGKIVVFSGQDMDIADVKTMYFYIIPGIKQFVKRLAGKPGDTLYFYGGRIYGFDKEGKDLKLNELPYFVEHEHIPFIRFEGKVEASPSFGFYSPVVFQQMNIPIAKMDAEGGKMLYPLKNYYDLWGMKNFAMAKILQTEKGPFLELLHHPTLTPRIIHDEYGRTRPGLSLSSSLIALSKEHLDAIFRHMTTSRFEVKNKRAYRYGATFNNPHLPAFDVPNGTYEFTDGIAYRVNLLGIASKLPLNHPIYTEGRKIVIDLYNLGIEWDDRILFLQPSRYAYFYEDELYLMGAPIFKKEDPTLLRFTLSEKQKASSSYEPFIDEGAPMKNGELDKEFIEKFGLKLPEKMYLVLGDNHAMSADSRDFGFVPQDNLRGCVSFLFWPPGARFGIPPQPFTAIGWPTVIIWIVGGGIGLISWRYYRRRNEALKRRILK